jgi:hypothetical protein
VQWQAGWYFFDQAKKYGRRTFPFASPKKCCFLEQPGFLKETVQNFQN